MEYPKKHSSGAFYLQRCKKCDVEFATEDPEKTNCGKCKRFKGFGKCKTCGKEYEIKMSTQRYCSNKCGRAYQRMRYHETKRLLPRKPVACENCAQIFQAVTLDERWCSLLCEKEAAIKKKNENWPNQKTPKRKTWGCVTGYCGY